MDQAYFRQFARRCRELMLRTANERVKEQLSLWAAEFDTRAGASKNADAAAADSPDMGPPGKILGPDSPGEEAAR